MKQKECANDPQVANEGSAPATVKNRARAYKVKSPEYKE